MTLPTFAKGDRVTLHHQMLGPLRLVVHDTHPPMNGGPTWVTLMTEDGYGRYRRPATEITRGWGD